MKKLTTEEIIGRSQQAKRIHDEIDKLNAIRKVASFSELNDLDREIDLLWAEIDLINIDYNFEDEDKELLLKMIEAREEYQEKIAEWITMPDSSLIFTMSDVRFKKVAQKLREMMGIPDPTGYGDTDG